MMDAPWIIEAAKLAVSVLLVLGVAWLVKRIGLGADPRIRDDAHAIALAEDYSVGFGGVDVGRDRAGYAALVRNAAGEQILVRAHGNFFAARRVDSDFSGRLDKDFLTLIPAEKTFGPVTLHLGAEAGVWASRMRDIVKAS
jgi:hypothetical protein